MNKKTLAEITNETIEVELTYKYHDIEICQKITVDEEGDHDWQIFNPVNGWGHSYYQSWSYQKADQNKDADHEQILVDAVQNGYNTEDILDTMYNSYNHETNEVLLYTDTLDSELFELETVPTVITVEMTVEF